MGSPSQLHSSVTSSLMVMSSSSSQGVPVKRHVPRMVASDRNCKPLIHATDVETRGEITGSVIDIRVFVEIALWIRATKTTWAIVNGGRRIIIGGRGICAPSTRTVVCARNRASSSWLLQPDRHPIPGILTRTIIDDCCGIKVARCRVVRPRARQEVKSHDPSSSTAATS